jgi:hypothetical protein
MGIAAGLLALSLLGADGAPGPESRPITYQVRVLEMDGLDWRKPVLGQFQPVTRQGSATVWTAPHEVVKPLFEAAGRVIAVPRVTAMPLAVAHFSRHTNVQYVSHLVRHADGPKDHATAVAYEPKVDGVREGFTATLVGRKLDQGILTRLVFEENRFVAMHSVSLDEMVANEADKGARGKTPLSVTVQVPETTQSEVAGEWLIPGDGALVVSLGAYTAADASGKAVVRERLAIVEARPLADDELFRTRFSTAPAPIAPSPLRPAVGPGFPMPMPIPATPSHSLPEGLAADGSPVPLPPLPDEHVTPTSLPGSAEPCASPQVPQKPQTKSDPDSCKTSFEPSGFDARFGPVQNGPEPPKRPEPTAAKPITFRIPLNAAVTIELRASVRSPANP